MRAGTGRNQETNGVKSANCEKESEKSPAKGLKSSKILKSFKTPDCSDCGLDRNKQINNSCRTHTSSSLEDFEESGDNAAIEESAALLNFRTIQPFRATVFQRWSTLHIKRILGRSLYPLCTLQSRLSR
jgi:hypothetical protein